MDLRTPTFGRARRLASAFALALASLGTLGFAPREAAAQDKTDTASVAAARQLGRQGIEHFDKGEYEEARRAFQQAYALHPAPTLAVREGRALAKLGRLIEASDAFGRAARVAIDAKSTKAFKDAAAEAKAELAAVRARIPTVTIVVQTKSRGAVKVTLDGVPVDPLDLGREVRVDPGEHVIEATVAGGESDLQGMILGEGESREVVVRPRKKGAPPPSRWVAEGPDRGARPASIHRAAAWATLGVSAASFVTGVVTGVIALTQSNQLSTACANDVCPESQRDALSNFRTMKTVSAIAYGGAIAFGATSLALHLTAPSARDAAGAAPREAFLTVKGVL